MKEVEANKRPSYDGPLADPVSAGLRGACPRCGRGRLFRGFLTLAPACDVCGLEFSFADAGDGPAVFVILIAGFFLLFGLLYVEVVYDPSTLTILGIFVPLTLALCLGLLRPIKGLAIALQYRNKAGEGVVDERAP